PFLKPHCRLSALARPKKGFHPTRPETTFLLKKDIFLYNDPPPDSGGLVQLQDKIVDRFALTIYPYSFGGGVAGYAANYALFEEE
ncbi:MAG: hypothetical protein ACYC5X_08005, partial [Syntrophales bacterium]